MSINNKTQAIDFVNSPITASTDNSSNLNPTSGFPIKYTNFSNFWKDFINYLFPTANTDLHGKSPIYRNTDSVGNYTETNTDYSNLTYQEIVPIGGIIMYGKAGNNGNSTIDGYLYCDGSVYDITLSTNFKYKRLYDIIGQSFHNPNNILHGSIPVANMLYLPDMRSKSTIGYDNLAFESPRIENGIINNTNGIGNMGGKNTTILELDNIPSHKHNIKKTNSVANTSSTPTDGVAWSINATVTTSGEHQHYFVNATYLQTSSVYSGNSVFFPYDFTTFSGITFQNNSYGGSSQDINNMPIAFYDMTIPSTTSPIKISDSIGNVVNNGGAHNHGILINDRTKYEIKGCTDNAGNVNPTAMNNRSAYVVVNYIIKY